MEIKIFTKKGLEIIERRNVICIKINGYVFDIENNKLKGDKNEI
jgi:hypothetical protein